MGSKIKILFCGDIHGSKSAFKFVKKKSKSVNLIVDDGDFTFFGEDIEKILEKYNSLNVSVALTYGNHESKSEVKKICKNLDNVTFYHNKFFVFKNVLFYVYGGGGFCVTEPKLEKKLPTLKRKILSYKKKIKNMKLVLVFHQPPFGVKTDYIHHFDEHVGSKSKIKIVKELKPDVVISGHIHESNYKRQTKNGTLFLNPGPRGRILRF